MIIFLDTSAIMYWLEVPNPFHNRLIDLLWQIHAEAPDAIFAVSRLSILECLVKPLRDHDQTLLSDYQAFFAAGQLRIVELGPNVVERAARLCASHGLSTPDAIQAASALSLPGEVLFIAGDHRYEKVPGLRLLLV